MVNSNVLTITTPFGSGSYTGGNQIEFTVGVGNNPTSVKATGTFTITTYNIVSAQDFIVD